MKRKITIQDMQNLAAERNGKCLSTEYVNSQTKLLWECANGHTWEAVPAKISYGQWCRKCSGYAKLSIDAMKRVAESKGGKCLSDIYINSKIKLLWECSEGHQWESEPAQINYGKWCPKCAVKKRGISRRLGIHKMHELAKSKGGLCFSTEYVDAHTPLDWQCANGHVWKAKPNAFQNGHWCPSCGLLTEEKCRVIFEQLTNLKFVKNKKVISPYELDGYNEDINLAFEYHGIQHYKFIEHFHKNSKEFMKRESVDKLKEEMCKEKNITLIVVPYTVSSSDKGLIEYIRTKLEENHIEIKRENVSLRRFYLGLKPLIKLNEIASKHGGECISTEYINNKTKIKWRCKEGHEWEAIPNSITSGQWCPECAKNQPLNIEEMHEIAKSRNGKCLSDEYKNNRTKLLWECEKEHKWYANPDAIKGGTWCPKCSVKRRTQARKLTIDDMKKLAIERKGLCLSDTYINSQTHLKWRCDLGHEWMARPDNIRNGTWCPNCKRRKRKSTNANDILANHSC